MKKYGIILIALLLFSSAMGQDIGSYYYYQNQKLVLEESNDKLLIRLSDPGDIKATQKLLAKIQSDIHFELYTPDVAVNSEYLLLNRRSGSRISKQEAINIYIGEPAISSVAFAYEYEDGTIMGISNEIVAKLKSGFDISSLTAVASAYMYTRIEQNEFDRNVYHIFFAKNAPMNALAHSTLFFESGIFEFAEPDFFRYLQKFCSTTDPLYGNQWGLENTGQYGGTSGADIKVCNAWNYSKGASIKVAVIDEGVDLGHPDLSIGTGFDATGGGSGGGPNNPDAHGTNCAGIIGAINNSIGVSGVAPLVQIIPVRIAIGNGFGGWITSDAQIANGINWAYPNADVLSNSWGGGSPSSLIDNAIANAVTLGRGGRGCVVVFSTGNSNSAVAYPATNANIIAVGAMSMCNQRKHPSSCDGENWWGSNFGSGLSVVAPGVKIETTDITGSNGYTGGDYNSSFNGTSSACPFVSGIAALMLSANPCMEWQEVRNVIELTADKAGSYTYGTSMPNGSWNNEMGYGRVNAGDATEMAYNMYRQNQYEGSVNKVYTSSHEIFSGQNVTTHYPTGNYTVSSTANITFYAANAIHLMPGFTAEYGAVYLGEINTPPCNTSHSHYKQGKKVVINNHDVSDENALTSTIAQGIEIYPNPTVGQFTIKLSQKGDYTVRVLNIVGSSIYEDEINDTQEKIIFLNANLPPGNYTVQVFGNSVSYVEKITLIR